MPTSRPELFNRIRHYPISWKVALGLLLLLGGWGFCSLAARLFSVLGTWVSLS